MFCKIGLNQYEYKQLFTKFKLQNSDNKIALRPRTEFTTISNSLYQDTLRFGNTSSPYANQTYGGAHSSDAGNDIMRIGSK